MLDRVRVANKFPDVKAHTQPSDFLASMSRGFGSPCQRPTSMQKLVLNRLHVLLRTRSALELGHRNSINRDTSRRREDLPGYWAILFIRAVVKHPAGTNPSSPYSSLEKIHAEVGIAFT